MGAAHVRAETALGRGHLLTQVVSRKSLLAALTWQLSALRQTNPSEQVLKGRMRAQPHEHRIYRDPEQFRLVLLVRLLEMTERPVLIAELRVELRQRQRRRLIGRELLNALLERSRTGEVSAARAADRQSDQRRRMIGPKSAGNPECPIRQLVLAHLEQRHARAVMGGAVVVLQVNGMPEIGKGVRMPPSAVVDDARDGKHRGGQRIARGRAQSPPARSRDPP